MIDVRLEPHRRRFRRRLRHLRRVDFRNLGMASRTLAVLARPRPRNWWHNRSFLKEVPLGLYRALFDPNAMNDFQKVRAEAGAVSTPADGLCAGVTERGRVSALFAPHTGFTNQVPYHVHDEEDRLKGARPREGAFFGVRFADATGEPSSSELTSEPTSEHGPTRDPTRGRDGPAEGDAGVEWLWSAPYDHEVEPDTGAGALVVTATRRGSSDGDGDDGRVVGRSLTATERIAVVPGTETLARDLTVRNRGDVPIESVVYYTRANANALLQYPPGVTSPNRAVARAALRWTDRESDAELRVFAAPDVTVLDSGVAEGALGDLFADAESRATGHYLSGFLELDVRIEPGETRTVSTFTTYGRDRGRVGSGDRAVDEDRSRAVAERSPTGRERDARDWWADRLADVDATGIPARHADGYRRALVDLLTLCDPESGSIAAAPHVQPAYYFSWPRDGAFSAVALARAGLTDPAVRFLADFLPPLRRADGSFEQCYASNGEPAGVIPVENDQQPAYAWAVHEVHTVLAREDPAAAAGFLARTWPAVRDALAYTARSFADNDLLAATHDYAEMWTDADQSLWTNALAYRGFRDGAALARTAAGAGIVDPADAEADAGRFERAAVRVGDAIDDAFFAVDAASLPVGRLSSGAEPVDGWSSVDGFASHLTLNGPEQRPTTISAVAAVPGGWADDYDRTADLLPALDAMYGASPTRWLPKEFLYAAACYRAVVDGGTAGDLANRAVTGEGPVDRLAAGDRVLEALADERLPGGAFAEEVGPDGEHGFAALGWSSATYVLALDERRRALRTVERRAEGDAGDRENRGDAVGRENGGDAEE
ncbi:hypothetical protein GRS48_04240 [Halorubrum sp. JWXQ-INN 858]|uniref:hypothetical protein n=1 Tax=Halorubrum sp. JWXQ-INN 858 TaxID=2690782 RepID=UPI0013587959|nr:hypothetical protein [Halorubrum sp. JWXQ-INN 858]MWV64035.1 hypothetical protein [Halorubrum sp. JWXQ-INN 858]